MNYLTDSFFWISTGLLVPVMVLLLIGFIYSLTMLGSLYGYHSDRRKFRNELKTLLEESQGAPVADIPFEERITHHPTFTEALSFAQQFGWSAARTSKALADFEIHGEKQLEKPKTLMRIGPMLGLMGTLIPMGPALVGLATGDIASMAMNMQVAFSTTVIGVFLGGVGFVIHTVRKRWFTEDFYQLQFIIDLAEHEKR